MRNLAMKTRRNKRRKIDFNSRPTPITPARALLPFANGTVSVCIAQTADPIALGNQIERRIAAGS
jgi:hypothetical protein